MLPRVPQRLRTEGIVLVPALAVVALLVYWAAHGGGYAATTWEPSALVVLGLLAATVAGLGLDRIRLSRPAAIALGALAAYTAWSYLSIAWAAAPGDALDGANRTLLYLLLFALFAILPWRTWTALTALSAYALGIGVLAVVTLVRIGSAGTAVTMFVEGRLVSPTSYENGSAALFLAGAIVPIALAARRELPVVLRGVLLGAATASLQVSVLCESRGWLFALPVVLLLAVALTPGRLRLLMWAAPPVAGTLVALPALLHVFERVDAARGPTAARADLIAAASHAASVALPVTGAVLAAGVLLALADRRVAIPAGTMRTANRAAVGLAVAVAVAGAAIGVVATHGRPDQAIARYWDRSSGYQPAARGSSRFARLGSNRPDFWRVSLDAFAAHPIGGVGQDNWAAFYLRHRHAGDQPRWTHSLELRLLAHTGLVGFLLFAGFLASALVATLRGRRRAPSLANAAAAVACLPLVVWFVHGSVDWFWEIPALSGPAFAFLALGGALMRREASVDAPSSPPWAGLPRALVGAGLGLLAVLAAAALALPYLAAREVASASDGWRADPARAFARLDRAARLNPLSAQPALVAGTIALELHEPAAAERRFAQALERDPDDWFAYFGQGLAASAAGERDRAGEYYRQARRLDPREPLLGEALKRVDGRRPLTVGEAFGALRRDVQRLTGDTNTG